MFICNVAPHQISAENELGLICWWDKQRLAGKWGNTEKDAIKEFLERWKRDIENKEEETGDHLKADWEWMAKVQKILRSM